MRWRLRFAEFDVTVTYKKGAPNTQPDILSRFSTMGKDLLHLEGKKVSFFTVNTENVRDATHVLDSDALWDYGM